MAAGQGYIEFATGDVLTAAAANGYLASQVVMVFASSAARTSAIASPQEGMISYLKDTDSTEYYSGSAWVAIGGATSGGMTLLSTTTLSGASTTVSVTSGYTDLYVLVYGVTNNTADNIMTMRTQNTGSVYRYTGVRKTASASAVSGGPDTSWNIGMNEYPLRTNANNIWAIQINDYLNTSHYKTINWTGSFVYSGPNQAEVFGGGVVLDNSAITSLVFANVGGTFSAGTVQLYGVK